MSSNYHYLFKFVIAGDAGVGKSTFIQQFTEETHRNTYIPTQRIHFASKIISANELQVKCQLWDMGQPSEPNKQQTFTGLADSLCKKAAAILLLFDLSNRATFANLDKWVQDIREKCDKNISIILVGNKIDREERVVSREEAHEFSNQAEIGYFQISSFDQKMVGILFQRVVKSILDKISTQKEQNDAAMLKSRIKRGKKEIQTPISPVNSSNEDREKHWQEEKVVDSEQMFSMIDKLSESLKKTCFLEEIIKKVKTNIKQKGIFYLSQIKKQFVQSRIVQSSSIIRDLFDIFSIIEQSSTEQHITLSRISIQNDQLSKYKQVQSQLNENKQKIEQLQKRIETLTIQKTKLEQYKDNSQNREQNLLQIIDKIKKEKKAEIEKYDNLLAEFSKLEYKNMQLTKELNRYKEEQQELSVQKLIQARQNSQIIDELQTLQENGVDASLLGKLRKKFSVRTSLTNSYNSEPGQLNNLV